ncbi:50S ribosomal protein L4 [Planctomycetota bacterium]
MLSIPIYDKDGTKTGDYELDPDIFGSKVRKRLLKDAILMYEANQRRGTHSTLTRSEVAGSGKKLFRQKGTGRARVGQRQTNKRRGGGPAFGPKPRSYRYSINRRARREALKSALLAKVNDNEILCIEDFGLADRPSTKSIAAIFQHLKLDRSVLIGLRAIDETVYKSARNIPRTLVSAVADFNAYDVVKQNKILLTRAALDELSERFSV